MVSAGVYMTIGGIRYSPLRSQYLLNCGILLHLIYCRTSVNKNRPKGGSRGMSRQLFFPYTSKIYKDLEVKTFNVGMGLVAQHCECMRSYTDNPMI